MMQKTLSRLEEKMARIYETQRDVKLDELHEKSRSARSTKESFQIVGVLTAFLGLLHTQISGLNKNRIRADKNLVDNDWKFDRAAGWTAFVVSIGSMVISLFEWNKAKKLENEAEKLGPLEIVYPKANAENYAAMGLSDDHVSRLEKARESVTSQMGIK